VVSFRSPSSLDWHVVVANGVDNSGFTNVDSVVYRWNGTALHPVQAQLPTRGASALEIFTLGGELYLAVASVVDTRYVSSFHLSRLASSTVYLACRYSTVSMHGY
jgi:hypothetical protein